MCHQEIWDVQVQIYVTENLRVRAGLPEDGFLWATAWKERRKKGLDHTTH